MDRSLPDDFRRRERKKKFFLLLPIFSEIRPPPLPKREFPLTTGTLHRKSFLPSFNDASHAC